MSGWLLPGEYTDGRRSARDRAVDAGFGAAALVVGTIVLAGTWDQHAPAARITDAAIGIAMLVALAWRRRRPTELGLLTALLAIVSAVAAGPAIVAAFNAAVHSSRRGVAAVGALSVVSTVGFPLVYPSGDGVRVDILVGLLLTGVVFGWGLLVRERRGQLARLRAQGVADAREAERLRIAREMHDVLAHRLSLIALHAGALEYRGEAGADVIREAARGALEELREVIGMLRDGTPDGPEAPQPTLAGSTGLVEECRAAGMDVNLRLDAAGVPPATGRTAYRIVQEGLTNASKHAPGAQVSVDVGRDGDRLAIVVRTRRPVGVAAALGGTGTGLLGLGERVTLAGGTLEHGPDAAGDFLLRAWLPWSAS